MNVRKMCINDCVQLNEAFLAQGWDSREEILHTYLKQQDSGQREILVAEENQQLLGYITLVYHPQNGPASLEGYPEIVDFNVFEAYQGRGIGSLLLNEVEKVAVKTSSTVMIGVGLCADYGPAQRLYVKSGYVPDGSGVWYKGKLLDRGATCYNDDELALYFKKQLL